MNYSNNNAVAMYERARFVTRFVSLMNSKLNYVRETRLFTLIFIGLPTALIFVFLPLHALGFISDLALGISINASMVFAATLYVSLVYTHTRISTECIEQVFREHTSMQGVLYQSANAQWADVDAVYA